MLYSEFLHTENEHDKFKFVENCWHVASLAGTRRGAHEAEYFCISTQIGVWCIVTENVIIFTSRRNFFFCSVFDVVRSIYSASEWSGEWGIGV